MVPLLKQILAQRQTNSYVPNAFTTDTELQAAIQNFYEQGLLRFSFAGQELNVLEHITQLISKIKEYDFEHIYISASELTTISRAIYGDWNAINNDLESYAQSLFIKKAGKDKGKPNEKKVSSWIKSKFFSLAEINAALDYNQRETTLESYWDNFTKEKEEQTKHIAFPKMAAHIDKLYKSLKKSVLKKAYSADSPLGSDDNQEDVSQLKNFLDALQFFYHAVKPFDCSTDATKDNNFYGDFLPFYQQLSMLVDLYNKTRNYLTQKATSGSKFKLTFDLPTLADGWDEDQQQANGAIILRRNGQYYLAILNTKNKPKFADLSWKKGEPAYEKMVYKLIANPTNYIPNLIANPEENEVKGKKGSKGKTLMVKGRKNANGVNDELEAEKEKYLPPEINRIRKMKSYVVNSPNFSNEDLHIYIAYYMQRLEEYKEDKFSFKFKKPNEYKSYDEFTDDVKQQAYSLSFENVSVAQVDQWVKEGKLFWFQIYNKDFSPNATGRKNLHTLYWLECFSPENLRDVVFKLNGKAELFLREKSDRIKTPFVHRKGESLLNRQLSKPAIIKGQTVYTIPENLFGELYNYANKKIRKSELSEDARLYEPYIIIKPVKHEITKDQRYTNKQYLFHVSITINFKSDKNSSVKSFNQRVQKLLRENKKKVQIIGLDRGETNLIYLTRMDSQGTILEQKSFNIIETDLGNDKKSTIDYQAKLTQRQEERKEARQSWKTIGQIKDLKAGYISQVVHEIVTMMIQHNAILVMENLNFGFKQGRFKVEKQVYQKFEKALIDKLNYLVFKVRKPKEEGGILNGYQLTPQVKKYTNMSHQCGFIFYVPAPYTSAIDPATGYVNPLKIQYKSIEKAKEFIQEIDNIRFSKKYGFEFYFDFSKFKHNFPLFQNKWKVCTIPGKTRYRFNPKTKQTDAIDVTDQLCVLFHRYGINLRDKRELKDEILQQTEAEFFREILFYLGITMQLRNRDKKTNRDFILSPIEHNGDFYDSETYLNNKDFSLPIDADANGAYHIALKGLWLLNNDFPENDWISKSSWLADRQKNKKDTQ